MVTIRPCACKLFANRDIAGKVLWVFVLTTMQSGCATPHTALTAGSMALDENPAAETVGSGRYAYQFVLTDPHTGTAWLRHSYALTTTKRAHFDLPFVSDEKDVYQGVSDNAGRTVVFRLKVRLPDSAWDLRERFGTGPNGETFRLIDPKGKGLADAPYLLVICSTPLQYHRGYTYPNGDTAYAASIEPEEIKLFDNGDIDDDDDNFERCKDSDALIGQPDALIK